MTRIPIREGSEAFTLKALALHLAGAAHGFGCLARLALGRLFIVATQLHFAEDAFTLHFFLEGLEGLINIVVTNENLHWVVNS